MASGFVKSVRNIAARACVYSPRRFSSLYNFSKIGKFAFIKTIFPFSLTENPMLKKFADARRLNFFLLLYLVDVFYFRLIIKFFVGFLSSFLPNRSIGVDRVLPSTYVCCLLPHQHIVSIYHF